MKNSKISDRRSELIFYIVYGHNDGFDSLKAVKMIFLKICAWALFYHWKVTPGEISVLGAQFGSQYAVYIGPACKCKQSRHETRYIYPQMGGCDHPQVMLVAQK